jgi:hypothetical protein
VARPANTPAFNPEREALIIELHAQHVPWRAIGAQVGLSHVRCREIFMAARDRIPAERLSDLRTDHHELAYRAIHDLLQIAENPQVSPRTRAEAWGQIRGWSESDRKLYGVDAPTRREITVISDDAVSGAITELNREMAAMEAQAREAGIKVDA